MRFYAALPLLTAALALASPSPKPAAKAVARDVNDTTAAIQFAVQADCDLFQCANVIASAGCIAAGLGTGMPEVVLACVASGSTGVRDQFQVSLYERADKDDADLPVCCMY